MQRIRVLLADDHALLRAGLTSLLGTLPDIEVIAEAEDGASALKLMVQHQPDVVLMDISMPGINGLEATAQAAKACPAARIIILSMHAHEVYVLQALRAGAAGYLLKDATAEELEAAIRTVANGELHLTAAASKFVVADYVRRSGVAAPAEELTPRQREILQLVATGHSTQDIAKVLFVTPKTVETHRAQLMERLNIRDVAGLTRYAIRIGLIQPDQ